MRVSEGAIRRLFRVGLSLKAAHSLVEIFAGLALAFIAHDRITALAWALTQDELLEDPHDLVADALRHAAEGMSADVQGFAAWYLFTHGAIKLARVAGVLANRLWAYPLRKPCRRLRREEQPEARTLLRLDPPIIAQT